MKPGSIDQDTRLALPFLGDGDLTALQSALVTVDLPAGDTLFRAGEPASVVYFLVSGRLAVQKSTGFADKLQVVALLDPGAPIGEGAIVPEQSRGATVVAIENCRLLSLERKRLENLKEQNPSLAWKIMTRLLCVSHLRLQKSSERLARIL